jgi:hypothetical protein
MEQTIVDALRAMAALNNAGDETMIIDNANEPAPIYGVIGEILDVVSGRDDLLEITDFAVSDDRIVVIKPDGYLETVPVYRRV